MLRVIKVKLCCFSNDGETIFCSFLPLQKIRFLQICKLSGLKHNHFSLESLAKTYLKNRVESSVEVGKFC